jgi:hypothetical protein
MARDHQPAAGVVRAGVRVAATGLITARGRSVASAGMFEHPGDAQRRHPHEAPYGHYNARQTHHHFRIITTRHPGGHGAR